MLPSHRLLSLLLHISLACSLHPGFARVVSFDRTPVSNARRDKSNSMNVSTPCPTGIESPNDRSPDNASYDKLPAETSMPVPVLSRLSFVLATRRPRAPHELDKHASSWRRDSAVHVVLVITGSATGGVLFIAVVAAILYIARRHYACAAEDEQLLLPGSTEKSTPVDNKPLLESTPACKVNSNMASHCVAFVPTETTSCRGSSSTKMPRQSQTTDPGNKSGADPDSRILTSTVIKQSGNISTTVSSNDDASICGAYVIVPPGALGDNASTTVTLRALDIPANNLVSSAGQIQLSAVFQCSVPGIVELHKAIVIRVPYRTFAPRGWRLGVLYRDMRCVGATRWMYADQLNNGCRPSEVGGQDSEVGVRANEVVDRCREQCHTDQPEPRRYDHLESGKNEVGIRTNERSPDPETDDMAGCHQKPHREWLQEHFLPDKSKQQQQQQQQRRRRRQQNSEVVFAYNDDYISIQTRHLTAVVCVAWPPSARTKAATAAVHDD